MAADLGLKLIVGLDYGTTKTCGSTSLDNEFHCFGGSILAHRNSDARASIGVAYSLWDPNDPRAKEINVVPFGNAPFTPSKIAYGDGQQVLWGDDASGGAAPGYSWTKVLLNAGSPDSQPFQSGLLARLVSHGLFTIAQGSAKPETVIGDFLRQIHEHLLRHLRTEFMDHIPPTEFWFAVPATWSENARHLMMNAIARAGFLTRAGDHVFIIPEAEAAALAEFSHIRPLQPGKSESILVCDCGGATSDITTFEISNNGSDNVFTLNSASTGVSCGGAEADCRLLSHLENSPRYSIGAATEQLSDLVETMGILEKAKYGFKGIQDPRLRLPNTGLIKVEAAEMRAILDPVVDGIIELVLGDIAERVEGEDSRVIDTVCLVGGFSQLPYLRNRLVYVLKDLSTVTHPPFHNAITGWSRVPPPRPGIDGDTAMVTRSACWLIRRGDLVKETDEQVARVVILHEERAARLGRVCFLADNRAGPPPESVDALTQRVHVIAVRFQDSMLRRAPWSMVNGQKTYFVRADVRWSVVITSPTTRAIKVCLWVRKEKIGEDKIDIAA
ncbi:hypothetical protein BJY00DRAFT_317822 [Aspergillus carlsbadensis]|nr:hypothetical protein BJY00DRAFT_317822 [Aspergillus carlsbadensis]